MLVSVELHARDVNVSAQTRMSIAAMLAWTICALALAALCGAWFFQFVVGLKPCPLCLEQRYAYYLAIPLSLLVAVASGRGALRHMIAIGLAIIALAMLANAGLGVYHAGVEWGFWPGPSDCSGPMIDLRGGSLLDRLDKVKVVRCDEVQWRFLGLSLAGYNVIVSLLVAALAARGRANGELRSAIGSARQHVKRPARLSRAVMASKLAILPEPRATSIAPSSAANTAMACSRTAALFADLPFARASVLASQSTLRPMNRRTSARTSGGVASVSAASIPHRHIFPSCSSVMQKKAA